MIGAVPHDARASSVISAARRRSSLPLSRDERRSAIVLAVVTVPAPAPWIVRALCETLARSEYAAGWQDGAGRVGSVSVQRPVCGTSAVLR